MHIAIIRELIGKNRGYHRRELTPHGSAEGDLQVAEGLMKRVVKENRFGVTVQNGAELRGRRIGHQSTINSNSNSNVYSAFVSLILNC